jgi:hypothetical protein
MLLPWRNWRKIRTILGCIAGKPEENRSGYPPPKYSFKQLPLHDATRYVLLVIEGNVFVKTGPYLNVQTDKQVFERNKFNIADGTDSSRNAQMLLRFYSHLQTSLSFPSLIPVKVCNFCRYPPWYSLCVAQRLCTGGRLSLSLHCITLPYSANEKNGSDPTLLSVS